jgi:dihydrofolate synthase/folylpolyglutamate synthase
MNYDQAVKYLLTLGRELASPQQARAAKFDLENITVLTERLGHPERACPSVHIAGTNGKGSTAAMLSSILQAAGLRTGLYTSPHLVRINERICLDGAEIADADFADIFTGLQRVIEELLANGRLAAHPTYFECVTAMAFEFFARQRADIVVLEVGMGGRLDSTNIVLPQVAVITQIDFDHENFLGHSIEQIAGEKAGIIKPGGWVVSAAGHPAACEVVRRRAAEQNARLVEPLAAYDISRLHAEDGFYRFGAVPRRVDASGANPAPARAIEIRLPLAGRFQVSNALTAIATAHLLSERGFPVDDAAIATGLATVRWPGRLERLPPAGVGGAKDSPAVYLDGTHNPAGARELVSFWEEHFAGRRIHLVYGTMRDKAVDEVAGLLFPRAATVILTESRQPRSLSAEALAAMAGHLASSVEIIPDPGAALERAIEVAAPGDVVFAAGSLYLVGDLHRYWDIRGAGKPPAGALLPAKTA